MLGTGVLSFTCCFGFHLVLFFTVGAADGLKGVKHFQQRLPSTGTLVPGSWCSEVAFETFLPCLWVSPHWACPMPLSCPSAPIKSLCRLTVLAAGLGDEGGKVAVGEVPRPGSSCLGSGRCSMLQRGELGDAPKPKAWVLTACQTWSKHNAWGRAGCCC